MSRQKTNQNIHKDNIKLRGFFRIQVTEDKDGRVRVVGDSGWEKNQVTNTGIRDYLVSNLIGATPKT
ncbi:MAG: hypothetical protein AABY22_16290, partial [Nanoarchaeota archaeon]